MFKIEFTRSAIKELKKLPKQAIQRITPRIDALAKDPYPPGSVKLSGSEKVWRIRIGDYRVVYSVEEVIELITIERIRHRKDAYRS